MRRSPDYSQVSGVLDGRLSVDNDHPVEAWVAKDGEAVRMQIHPLVESLSVIGTTVPNLSVYDVNDTKWLSTEIGPWMPWQRHVAYPNRLDNADYFLRLPASINNAAYVPSLSTNGEVTGVVPAENFSWTSHMNTIPLWMDPLSAFNGAISTGIIESINSLSCIEELGWGDTNGKWLSAIVPEIATEHGTVIKEGVDLPFSAWRLYSPDYITYGANPFTTMRFLQYQSNAIDTRMYDMEGHDVKVPYGIYKPVMPSVWPTNCPVVPANAEDVRAAYWNLSKLQWLGRFIPAFTANSWWLMTGRCRRRQAGQKWEVKEYTDSDMLSGNSDYLWSSGSNLNYPYQILAYCPYASIHKIFDDGEEHQATIQGRALGQTAADYQTLSASFESASFWYWNNQLDRIGEVKNVWYIVPVVGYSAAWREWTDSTTYVQMSEMDHFDVKISMYMIPADRYEDQTTKSWKAYTGTSFWN